MTTIPAGFAPLLDRLRTHDAFRGDAFVRFRILRHIEGRFSDVLRVRVSTPRRHLVVFVKRFKERPPYAYEAPMELASLVRTEFSELVDVYETMRAQGLRAARPLALFEDVATIVTEEAEGMPLSKLLRRVAWRLARPKPIRDHFARVGKWLRVYQSAAPALPQISLADQRVYLDQRLRYLSGRVLTSSERRSALAFFDCLADGLGTALRSVAVHGDLCPANIIVAPDGVTILDFSMAASGSPLHDVSHLYLHLEFLKWNGFAAADAVSEFQQALLFEFNPELCPTHPRFLLMMLRHVVCHVTQVADSGKRGTVHAKRRWRQCFDTIPLLRQADAPAPSWKPTAAL